MSSPAVPTVEDLKSSVCSGPDMDRGYTSPFAEVLDKRENPREWDTVYVYKIKR